MNKVLRKILGTSVAVLTVASVTLVANTGFAADVELRASHQWNTKDVRHEMVQIIADEIANANVGMSVKMFPAKALYKPKEQWAPLTTGELDISAFPLAYAGIRSGWGGDGRASAALTSQNSSIIQARYSLMSELSRSVTSI